MPTEHFNPEAQIAFAQRLGEINELSLGAALRATVASLDIPALDRCYSEVLGPERLRKAASFSLRPEVIFPCALLLQANPRLLGYYRLLYGLSQKEFYRRFGRFRAMEERGVLPGRVSHELDELCTSLCETGWILLNNLPQPDLGLIRDLQLLALGAQLRGARLNEIGAAAVQVVFTRIRSAISHETVVSEGARHIELHNAAGLLCLVAFSSDPDIAISQELPTGRRNVLAIEVKGGTDVSNIHNRLGEAEKSHQKARSEGFTSSGQL